MRWVIGIIAFFLFVGLLPSSADADTAASAGQLPDLAVELGKLVAVVAVVESALSALFNWRVYRVLFNDRALKTPIMFAVGLLIVTQFQYDIFGRVIARALAEDPANWSGGLLSTLLSAMIIAGGTSGINTLFQRLGIRNPLQTAEAAPTLNMDEAWIAIHVVARPECQNIRIAMKETEAVPDLPLVGSVQQRGFWQRLSEAFSSDAMRFPNYGGRKVRANKVYEISLVYSLVSAAGVQDREAPVFTGGFGPRAVIDLRFALPEVPIP